MKNYQRYVADQANAFYDSTLGEFEKAKEAPGGASDAPDFVKWLDQTGAIYAWVEKASAEWDKLTILKISGQTRHKSQFGGAREKAVEGFAQDLLREVKKLHKNQAAAD
ncbi:MAG: hypothetical protein RL885_29800 [Planctomycetota bacterium]